MEKMTAGDRKGDTARGARAAANANARRWDKEGKARKAKLASQITGRAGIVPIPAPKPSSNPPVAIDTAEPVGPPSPSPTPKFVVKEADLEDLPEVYQSMFTSMCDDRDAFKQQEVSGNRSKEYRKQADEMIRELFTSVGYNRVVLPDGRIAEECRGATESTISATRLLELGVDADIVAAAKVPGKPYFFVKVRPLTDKEKEARELRMRAKAGAE